MMLENESQLRATFESIAKLYRVCDGIAADTTGHAATREAEIDGLLALIRKMERQVAVYLAAHPERWEQSASNGYAEGYLVQRDQQPATQVASVPSAPSAATG